MPFNLFHKKKEPAPETPAVAPQTEPPAEAPAEPTQEAAPENTAEPQPEAQPETEQQIPTETQPAEEAPAEPPQPEAEEPQPPVAAPAPEPEPTPEVAAKTYLKAMPLKDLSDVEGVKEEVSNGNIIILRVTPLAGKSIEDVKTAVNELFEFAESSGGDIARLGEERVVICPKTVRIWREKTPAPVASSKPLPTAA